MSVRVNNLQDTEPSTVLGRRYTKKYLRENGYSVLVLESGSKADIHKWQYDMNMYYKYKYGKLPPLNRRGW